MTLIRPCADLRNNYNEIPKLCHETNEPIFITKNGSNDLVILSDKAYENLKRNFSKSEEAKVEELISKHFDKHYKNFEDFKENIIKQINEASNEISNGKGIPMEDILKEMGDKMYDK